MASCTSMTSTSSGLDPGLRVGMVGGGVVRERRLVDGAVAAAREHGSPRIFTARVLHTRGLGPAGTSSEQTMAAAEPSPMGAHIDRVSG